MAEIRPFRGLRYDTQMVGDLAAVVAPPYDVIDAAAQDDYYRRSPHNIIRLELGKQSPTDSEANSRYTRAAGCLADWRKAGILRAEPCPAVYVYQHEFVYRGRRATRTGFLASLRLEEWEKRVVLPHEATMSGPKADRLRLMQATKANLSPIFVLYDDPGGRAGRAVAHIVAAPPAIAFSAEGEEHRVWVVSDPAVCEELATAGSGRPLFIADGHHRYETALQFRDAQRASSPNYSGNEEWNFAMALLVAVDDPGLLALPTHRLVNPRRDPVATETLAALTEHFQVHPLSAESDRQRALSVLMDRMSQAGADNHLFGAYGITPGRFALLAPKSEANIAGLMPAARAPSWRRLDVSILHEVLVRRVFGLTDADAADETRVAYTRDEAHAVKAVDAGQYRLALFLNPTPVRSVTEVAHAGDVMPHKSTYFHPKPLTGVVLHLLTDR